MPPAQPPPANFNSQKDRYRVPRGQVSEIKEIKEIKVPGTFTGTGKESYV